MKRRNRLDSLRKPVPWHSFILMIVTGSLAALGIFLLNPARAQALSLGEMPVALHSNYAADYSADLRGYLLPPVSLDIVDQIIEEKSMTHQDEIQNQVERVRESLNHPVPTVSAPTRAIPSAQPTSVLKSMTPTIAPSWTVVPANSSTPTAVMTVTHIWVVSSPTSTEVEEHPTARPTLKNTQAPTLAPTETSSATFTLTPTKIQTAMLTETQSATPTATQTATQTPTFTASAVFTATSTQTATKTIQPPSATPSPTGTPVPSPTAIPQTATQPPSSATPVPSVVPTQAPTPVSTEDWIQLLIDTYCPIVENQIPTNLWPMLDRLRELCAEAGY